MPHHSLKDFSKAGVCAINPRGPNKRDIELRPVGIFTSISHADPASPVVFMYEVFISEIFPIYTVPTSAIRIGEISTCEGQEMLLVAAKGSPTSPATSAQVAQKNNQLLQFKMH